MQAKATFGLLLKQYRKEAGLTQGQLGELSGLTQEEIARFEADGRKPSWVTVHKIASALGKSCDAFKEAAEAEAELPRKERPVKKAKKKPSSGA